MTPLPKLTKKEYEKKCELYSRTHPKVRANRDRFYLTFSDRATSCRECGYRIEAGREYLYRGLNHVALCRHCGRRFKVRYEESQKVKERRGDPKWRPDGSEQQMLAALARNERGMTDNGIAAETRLPIGMVKGKIRRLQAHKRVVLGADRRWHLAEGYEDVKITHFKPSLRAIVARRRRERLAAMET